ncbi:MAG: ATP phosphoribosyltransferase, partial [Bacteroidetes bacterium]|nr:ATP phosphoribosyltransferase [Bacteroidota bacterium]
MNRLKLAIQKSGRLHDDSIALLKEAGISINNGRDQLKAPAQNFPLEVYYLRNGDIPKYLQDGVVDLAIIGENLLVEKGREIEIIERLKFSKCRVSIAVPKGVAYSSIQDLAGKRIATSYPNTLKSFLDEQAIVADIHVINGSVEIAPNIGL